MPATLSWSNSNAWTCPDIEPERLDVKDPGRTSRRTSLTALGSWAEAAQCARNEKYKAPTARARTDIIRSWCITLSLRRPTQPGCGKEGGKRRFDGALACSCERWRRRWESRVACCIPLKMMGASRWVTETGRVASASASTRCCCGRGLWACADDRTLQAFQYCHSPRLILGGDVHEASSSLVVILRRHSTPDVLGP